jgi:hypothetical protein
MRYFTVVLFLLCSLFRSSGAIINIVGPVVKSTGRPVCYDSLVFKSLGSVSSTVDGTTFATTSSYQPVSNSLVVAYVYNSKATTPDTPTFSGNGLTWVQITTATCSSVATPTLRVTAFRAQGTAPTSTAGTATFGVAQTGCIIQVFEVWNADASAANGANAVVQAVTSSVDASANPLISFAAPTKPGTNAMVFGYVDNINSAADSAPETNWVEMSEFTYATPSVGAVLDYSTEVFNVTTVTNIATSRDYAAIALEIRPQTIECSLMIADVFNDMAGQTPGTQLTTTILTNGTHGTYNGWSESITPFTFVKVGAHQMDRLHDVMLGTTRYTIANASFSIEHDALQNFRTEHMLFPQSTYSVGTVAFNFYLGVTNANTHSALWDLVGFYGTLTGEYCSFQLNNGNGQSSGIYAINIETNPGGSTTHSVNLVVLPNTKYWGVLRCDYNKGIAHAAVFDALTGAQLAGSPINVKMSKGDTYDRIRFIQNEAGVSTGTNFFENIVVAYKRAPFPWGN